MGGCISCCRSTNASTTVLVPRHVNKGTSTETQPHGQQAGPAREETKAAEATRVPSFKVNLSSHPYTNKPHRTSLRLLHDKRHDRHKSYVGHVRAIRYLESQGLEYIAHEPFVEKPGGGCVNPDAILRWRGNTNVIVEVKNKTPNPTNFYFKKRTLLAQTERHPEIFPGSCALGFLSERDRFWLYCSAGDNVEELIQSLDNVPMWHDD